MRPSHNLPIPPEYLLLSHYMQRSHNISPPPPPFKHLHATLTEFTLRSKIYPHFKLPLPSQNMIPPIFENYMRYFHNPPLPVRIYPFLYQVRLPESTPSFQHIPPLFYNYMRCSQTLPRPPRIYPPLSLRNATLPESTHPFRIYPLLHHYMRHSHNRPLPPLNILMRHSRNPPLTQNTPLLNIYMRPSQNLPLPPRIYPPLNIHMLWWETPESKPSWPKIYSPF